MNLSELFIRRPVMTSLLMLAILLFGLLGYRALAVSDLPNVDFPTIQVSAGLPGASPDTMASSVASPLEKQFTTISGLDSMTSSSSLGNTQITLQFDLNRDIDSAALDVQTAISAAARHLPPNLPSPPTFRKVNPADQPIFGLGVTSPTLPLYEVDKYAENLIATQMSEVPGVAQVTVNGAARYAVRVQMDPAALASRQIGIDEVEQAIRGANVNLPMGTLFGAHKAYNVQSNGQLSDARVYRPLIVAYRNGAPVRLDQIASVRDGVEDQYIANWVNGVPGIMLSVQRQPGTNTIEIVNRVRKLIPGFYSIVPPSINLSVEYDRSVPIRRSVDDVQFTLLLAVFLVILVIFLFLRNVSATVMPSLALPMAIMGTFAVMYLLGYTIDTLSLLALTLSVGFVVDDAIVMLENIVRHMEMGKSALDAALAGSKEVSFTILAMTLSLAVVFLPVFFMPGVFGRLLHEFAVVIVSAVLVSGLVSLTLTPMLSKRYLHPEHDTPHGRMYHALGHALDGALRRYGVTLRWALRHRVVVMAFGLLVLVGTAWEFWTIPKGFLPEEDLSQISVSTQANQGISFEAMKAHQEAVNRILKADPNVVQFFSTVRASNSSGLNNGRAFLHLKDPAERPWTENPTYDRLVARHGGHAGIVDWALRLVRPLFERHMTIDDVMHELQPKLNRVPGIRVFLQNPPAIRIGGRGSKSLYQFTLSSPDLHQLYASAQALEERMSASPDLVDVTSDLQLDNPQANVVVDRDKASALGVTSQEVENALYSAYGQRLVSPIYTSNDEYWVVLQVQSRFQRDPGMLSELYVRSSSGRLVPLGAVSRLTTGVGPLTLNHTGQLPSVTISFNLARGIALGQAVSDVQSLAASLPISVTTAFQGAAQAFQQSLSGLGILLVMTVLVIYIVLGILYESYFHPITILTGLPAAAFGGLVTLSMFHQQLDIYGFVGLIMLIGIVKKNAIMMIDFALDLERSGNYTSSESAYQGCMIRFRPIMMTSACTIMGTLPIAIGFGADAAARRSLGLCVVGGLVFAQFVTLYLTPVFYTYMDAFLRWRRAGGSRAALEA